MQSVRTDLETGVLEGADLLYDGRDVTVDGYEGGNFPGVTVFGDVAVDTVIARGDLRPLGRFGRFDPVLR